MLEWFHMKKKLASNSFSMKSISKIRALICAIMGKCKYKNHDKQIYCTKHELVYKTSSCGLNYIIASTSHILKTRCSTIHNVLPSSWTAEITISILGPLCKSWYSSFVHCLTCILFIKCLDEKSEYVIKPSQFAKSSL